MMVNKLVDIVDRLLIISAVVVDDGLLWFMTIISNGLLWLVMALTAVMIYKYSFTPFY